MSAVAAIRAQPRGFTLIELMVTLVVLAVLTLIAVPNFRDTMRRSRVSSASNALLADLAYARSEAVSRGNYVSVCPGNAEGSGCQDGQAYEGGWLVYTYKPGQGVPNQDYSGDASKEVLLRATQARNGVSIQAMDGNVLTFGPQGQLVFPAGGAGAAPAGLDFVTCYRDGAAGIGVSSASVTGVSLTVRASGSVATSPLTPPDGACTATAPNAD